MKLGEKPRYTWDEACVRFLQEKGDKKSLHDDKQKIKNLAELRGIALVDVTRDFIYEVVNKRQCSNSTKNRYLALIRSILRLCERQWEWIDKAPAITLYKEPKKRIRWLKPEEAQKLVDALVNLPYMQHMVIFSFATGLRQRNVLDLKWEQVDLQRRVAWIYADEAKAGRAIGVSLNDAAMQVLYTRKALGIRNGYVFNNGNGTRVKSVSGRVWKEALERAGITNFRWHDMRHTWASWLAQAGTPLAVLQEMGGWESIEMVQKYAHLAPVHLAQYAAALDGGIVPGLSGGQSLSKVGCLSE